MYFTTRVLFLNILNKPLIIIIIIIIMIVGGQTEARAQLSSTIINYHEPFDQGLIVTLNRQFMLI